MRKKILRYVFAACCLLAGSAHCQAGVVSFGSGANQFNMEFVTIGNPGNAADNTGTGAVGYTYGIGKFEVSRDMITKFNASQSLQITLLDMSTYGGNGANKPATGITWNEAARFVNWLNTSTGSSAAYKFTTGGVNDNISVWTATETEDYDPLNPFRSKRATYVLPSYHEWHKAAYYDPVSSTYHRYPNGRDTPPIAVASGTDDNTAIYNLVRPSSADINQAGGLSPYGVMGLGGNVAEWTETSFDFRNVGGSHRRLARSGASSTGRSFLDRTHHLSNFDRNPYQGNLEIIGIRVATLSLSGDGGGGGGGGGEVPEPSTMAIFGLGALGMVFRSRRRKST